MSQVLGAALMLIGSLLTLIAGFGLVRLPTGLSRIHAAAKPASLGLALVALGAGVAAGSWGLAATGALVAVLQFVTAPIAGPLLGRTLGPADPLEAPPSGDPIGGSKPSRRWSLIPIATLIWIVLWRDLSLANLLAGLSIGLVAALVVRRGPGPSPNPFRALATLGRYSLSLVVANARVAYQVVAVRDEDLQETVVVCDLDTRLESVAFFDANATSFAPGTLTLEISSEYPYRMVVHAMGLRPDEVQEDVAELERGASRMFD